MAEFRHVRRIMVSLWGERVGTIVPLDARQTYFGFQYERQFLKSGDGIGNNQNNYFFWTGAQSLDSIIRVNNSSIVRLIDGEKMILHLSLSITHGCCMALTAERRHVRHRPLT